MSWWPKVTGWARCRWVYPGMTYPALFSAWSQSTPISSRIWPWIWADASRRLSRRARATWSLRLRPVGSRLPAAPTRAARVGGPGVRGLPHKGVRVLGRRVAGQRAAVPIVQDAVQALVDGLHVLLRDDALPPQHGGVDQAAPDVLLDQTRIEADRGIEVI